MLEHRLYLIDLFELYGPLLTEKQQEFFRYYYYDDLSLAEIADLAGVSRPAVHDLLHRAENSLTGFEERLGILRLRRQLRETILAGKTAANESDWTGIQKALSQMEQLLDETTE